MSRHIRAAAALVLAALSSGTLAAPCGTFTDVQDTDAFCNATQWLKNRGVTLGCTSATLYCPADVVTRASMALFMNRLGIALTPRLLGTQAQTTAATLQPNQFQPYCLTETVPAVNYPRIARATGSITAPMAGPLAQLFLVVTLDGAPFANMNFQFANLPAPNGTVPLTWTSNVVNVPAGSTAAFAVGVSNPAGSGGNLNLSAGTCAVAVDIVNANPTSPPFDR
jgi:hypothetical protein